MTAPLTIALAGADPQHRYAPLVAGLPVTLDPADGRADLVVAFDQDSLEEAIARAGTAALLVDPSVNLVLAGAGDRVPVLVSETYAGSVGFQDYTAVAAEGHATFIELEATGVGRDEAMDEVLLQLLRVAEAAGLELPDSAAVAGGDAAFVVDGTTSGGTPFTASASRSPGPRSISLTRNTADGGTRILLPDGATARPPIVETLDGTGARVLPTRYESALRATVRRIAAGDPDVPTLESLGRAARLARALMRPTR